MSTPFNVSKFVRENKDLVNKYLKKDTYGIKVPDVDVDKKDWYQKNPNVLKARVQKPEFTQLQKLEYIKCAKKPEYFTRKYIKIISVDDGVIPFEMYDYQKKLLRKCARNRFVITLQSRQSGKMLDLDTPILTPDGMVRNGDLKIGDTIYGRDGKPTQITYISEQRNDMKQYKITFDNDEVVYACGEHLWNVGYGSWNSVKDQSLHERTLKTDDVYDLFQKGQKEKQGVSIKTTEPVEFKEQEVNIEPYMLGLWLGDGTSANGNITCMKEDYDDYLNNVNGVSEYRDFSYRCGNFKTNKFQELKQYNLINNKHIPAEYIYNSYNVRKELIQGLMDSDGNCDQKGSCEFYQKDKKMCEDFRFILSTLGIKSRLREKIVNGQTYHTVSFSVSVDKMECFKLKRKLELQKRLKNHKKNSNHYIKNMELLDEEDKRTMQCLTVDNEEHLFLCSNSLIPTHNTSVNAAYILWYNNFNSSKQTAILANKAAQARQILARVKLAYEFLPNFLKQGVSVYNKGTVTFGNKSNMFAASSSSDSIRGESVSLLYIDEAAFLRNDMEFYESTYPTISSGKHTRVLISSTPKGARGLFYKLWQESVEGKNDYVNHKVTWDMVPGRDKAWREEQIRNTSREQFDQEHNVVFKGSINSLIPGHILDSIPVADPVETRADGDLKIYKQVEEGHSYITVCDVSKGLGADYHAFTVWDITKMPYEVVATYKNNKISTMMYPSIIHNTCLYYNSAMTLIELNNSGEEVANILFYELEYENMLSTFKENNRQKLIFGGVDRYGVTTTQGIKSVGCNTIKKLIEDGVVQLNDEDLIEELGTFVPKGKSYEADKGAHDDLVMTAVLFGWASTQEAFKEFCNLDTRKKIIQNNEEHVMPFGFIENDVPDVESDDSFENYLQADTRFAGAFQVQEVDRNDPFFDGF